MLENDVDELNRVTRSLYENADERAVLADLILSGRRDLGTPVCQSA